MVLCYPYNCESKLQGKVASHGYDLESGQRRVPAHYASTQFALSFDELI